MKEIERKYLLDASIVTFLDTVDTTQQTLTQFYTKVTPRKSVRFRKSNHTYYKTIKEGIGSIRKEKEKEISQKIFEKKRHQHIGKIIQKKRYLFSLEGDNYSVDIYKQPFDSLYILEVEFDNIFTYENFQLPEVLVSYVHKELTEDESYKNKNLALFGLPYDFDNRPYIRSSDTLKDILEHLRVHIMQYRQRVIAGGDDEDLHQLRIALRKTVVLIGSFSFLFKQDEILQYQSALKEIISMSNQKRDLDVLKIKLDEIGKDLKNNQLQNAFYLFDENIQKELETEHLRIMAYLQSKDCIHLLQRWEIFINTISQNVIVTYQSYSMVEVSKFVIYDRFLKIVKMIESLKAEHDDSEVLHKLRIAYKKLRYLLESFGYLYSEQEIKKLLKEIKKLQNILGEFHDSYQQDLIFKALSQQQEDPTLKFLIENIILSKIKHYQKKEILAIQKEVQSFLTKKKIYQEIFNT